MILLAHGYPVSLIERVRLKDNFLTLSWFVPRLF